MKLEPLWTGLENKFILAMACSMKNTKAGNGRIPKLFDSHCTFWNVLRFSSTLSVKTLSVESDEIFTRWRKFLPAKYFYRRKFLPTNNFAKFEVWAGIYISQILVRYERRYIYSTHSFKFVRKYCDKNRIAISHDFGLYFVIISQDPYFDRLRWRK